LTIYSAGGVEKITKTSEPIKPATAKVKASHSEAKIIRNADGTTSVVYPDSDDEKIVDGTTEPPTDVVKG